MPEVKSSRVLVLRVAAGLALVAVLAIIINFVMQSDSGSNTMANLQKEPVQISALPSKQRMIQF